MNEEPSRKQAFIEWMFPTYVHTIIIVLLSVLGMWTLTATILPFAYFIAKCEKRNLYLAMYFVLTWILPFVSYILYGIYQSSI